MLHGVFFGILFYSAKFNDYVSVKVEGTGPLSLCIFILKENAYFILFYFSTFLVLLTYISCAGFLPRVLAATNSLDDNVASTSLQLTICIIYFFSKNNYIVSFEFLTQSEILLFALQSRSIFYCCARQQHIIFV